MPSVFADTNHRNTVNVVCGTLQPVSLWSFRLWFQRFKSVEYFLKLANVARVLRFPAWIDLASRVPRILTLPQLTGETTDDSASAVYS